MASAVLAPWSIVTAAEGAVLVLAVILIGAAMAFEVTLQPATTAALLLLAVAAVLAVGLHMGLAR